MAKVDRQEPVMSHAPPLLVGEPARTCLVTGALLPWTGGPLRSIGAFQRALDASVVSFLQRCDLSQHALPLPKSRLRLVACRRIPGFRHFLIPELGELHDARQFIDTAELVSCHSFYNSYPAWMYRVCRRRGMPYWLVPHGILDPYVADRNRLVKRFYMSVFGRACLANASAVVFSTKNERDKAAQNFRIANPVVINWPVDIPTDVDRESARAHLRSLLGIAPESRVILYLGRLHPMKRPLETIQLFSEAKDRSWHMLLVGHPDGVSEEECRRSAQACGVADRIHVLPGIPGAAVGSIIQGCDLFVSYSRRENFNNAAAECLAAGLPILLSPGNDLIADIGVSPAVGTLPDSPIEAVAALTFWTSMGDAERIDRGREGRAWAAANLSFDVFRDRLVALRRDTLSSHG